MPRFVKVSRNTINHNRRNISLDQRSYISNEIFCYVGSLFVYPFSRYQTFVVGNLMHIFHLCSTLIRIVRMTYQYNHLSAVAFVSSLNCGTTYLVSFQNIYTGTAVRC